MAIIRLAFFSGLCFSILLLARSVFQNKVAIDAIYSEISDSNFSTSLSTVKAGEPSNVSIIEVNRTFPVSTTSSNFISGSHQLCSREEIKYGSWEPVVLDAPPYLPRTVHLQCYPESEYKAGQWMHTYKWLPAAAASEDCTFPDWNRGDFCRLLKRATVLVRFQSNFTFFMLACLKWNAYA
jgi:hypothetical protein